MPSHALFFSPDYVYLFPPELLFGLCNGNPQGTCLAIQARAAEVHPGDPVPCVKPWVLGETKAQHEAKLCLAMALRPEGIQQT